LTNKLYKKPPKKQRKKTLSRCFDDAAKKKTYYDVNVRDSKVTEFNFVVFGEDFFDIFIMKGC